jgi:hypothetical protein
MKKTPAPSGALVVVRFTGAAGGHGLRLRRRPWPSAPWGYRARGPKGPLAGPARQRATRRSSVKVSFVVGHEDSSESPGIHPRPTGVLSYQLRASDRL